MVQLNKLSAGKELNITDLLELPRPGAALPNPSSTLALWPSTIFSFDAAGGKGRTERCISLVELPKESTTTSSPAQSTVNPASQGSDDAIPTAPPVILNRLAYNEAAWLDDRIFLYLRPDAGDKKSVDADGSRLDHPVHISDAEHKQQLKEGGEGIEVWAKDVLEGEEYLVGKLPVVVSNLQIANISSGKEKGAILAFSATVYPDGDVYKVASNNKKAKEEAQGSDARVYDSTFVRHWDTWSSTDGEVTQLHFVRLSKNPESISVSDDEFEHVEIPGEEKMKTVPGRWTMVAGKSDNAVVAGKTGPTVKSPLAGTTLECPVGAFGDGGDFDLSTTHLVFHAKDPHLNPAWHTRTIVYLVPLSPKSAADAKPKALTAGVHGATSSPRFSKDGKRVAWLEMRQDGYEADRNRVMIYDIATGERYGVTENWDRSPSRIEWCPCNEKLYLTVEDEGRVKLYQLSVPLTKGPSVDPEKLTHKTSLTSATALSTSEILLTSNSLTSPNFLSLLSFPPSPPPTTSSASSADLAAPSPKVNLTPLATLTKHLGEQKDLAAGEDFWFPGASGAEVHGYILFPPGFELTGGKTMKEEEKKWPLAFLVHGGPQSAWTDSWSTRWNPNIYASAGYITVTINPTGSTGYGQAFCDAIKDNWGGLPFQDLVAGLNFVKEAFPVDPERMAMLGASYGGFMANWIQGHNEHMRFKCIVCHDGIFSTVNTWYSTEELYFPEREFGGTPWTASTAYAKYNPANFVPKWKTPQLVIHGGRDYRLCEAEGISAFNALQRLGVPSRFLYFGSENHWVLSPHNGRRWHFEVLKWIDEWTGESEAVRPAPGEHEALVKQGYNPSYFAHA